MFRKQMIANKKEFFSRVRLGIFSLLTLILCISLSSGVQAQITSILDLKKIPGINQTFQFGDTLGNLAYAPVKLDGYTLFNLASPISYNEESNLNQSIPPAQIRAKRVESILQRIIKVGTPDNFQVKIGILNHQTVIFASDQNYPNYKQPIVTITPYEAQLYGSPIQQLAKAGAQKINTSLIRAWNEREPEYLKKQSITAFKILIGIIITNLVLLTIKKRLNARWQYLKHKKQEDHSELSELTKIPDNNEDTTEYQQQLIEIQHQNLRLRRQRDWIFLWRLFVIIGMFSVWFVGLVNLLKLFPDTRGLGVWLEGKPAILIGIWLLMGLLKKISDLVISRSLKSWAEDRSLKGKTSQRFELRIEAYSSALQGVTTIISIAFGLYLTLLLSEIPMVTVLAGAGFLGLIISLGVQEFIQDALTGFLILSIDPYTIGDFIRVGDVSGTVETVNLFFTQIRSPEGELITIPHGSMKTVRNSTKEWSRLNFKVKVNYDTDVDKVIEIIRVVALDLYFDTEWSGVIIEQPPELIGVEDLSYDGILIQAWIKTQPKEQWNLGREFRRRLKQRFDQAGISIGVPRLELQLDSNGQVMSHKS
ncbi:MAG: mechanosensitive ion channel family protein [Cyanobacteria bacterium J06592_8]